MIRVAVIGIVGESVFLTVPRHQAVGETAHATSIYRELGGKGYNQAVAAARFGADVSFLGAVAESDVPAVTAHAVGEGITPVLIGKDEASPYGVIVTDSTGDNRVTVYSGAALTPPDVEKYREMIEKADVLLINNEVPPEVNDAAVRIAKASGVTVIMNPAPIREISDYLKENVDLFTPNEHEREMLAGLENVIVTLGEKGVATVYDGKTHPAIKVSAIDTTGAGDTFSGVLSVLIGEHGGISRNELPDLSRECRIASVAASLEVTRRYVMPAIPTREEALDFLSKH